IMITAYGKIKDGVEAIKTGAFDYITKGDIDEDEFIFKVKNAFEKSLLKHQIKNLKGKVESKFGFSRISGNTKVILNAVDLAKKVAETDAAVLLLGETGTGKELFAQAIHYSSSRKDNSFVALNCSAIPKDLQESELFGYVKGAFTGAVKDKKGFFEEAHLGTIFLDEIGDLSQETQAKLLRVLESGTFSKIGDAKTMNVDVRIISATNKDLLSETESHNFRSDLYYRLNGFTIKLPALNERIDDIEILANEFVKLYSGKSRIHVKNVSEEYIDKLKAYKWKGNIRELKNIIERSIILSGSETLTIDTLPAEFLSADESSLTVIQKNDNSTANQSISLKEIEKNHILKIYSENNFNKTLTAEKLGIGSVTLYRKLKEYDVE
ncbi:MAG TPA: sigma-54 dependent transcriptional regulator, partial [Ignavibacteria bacterium]|nr:sigma-54 dependent transcriptional regulator [Ignavibacteria bacterium]